MKKIYLIVGCLAMSTFAIAQTSLSKILTEVPMIPSANGESIPMNDFSPKSAAPFDTVFGEDFGGGVIPTGWNAVALTGTCNWTHTTLGPQGQYSGSIGPLASTTGANGYMILDGDFCNSAQPFADVDAYLETPSINLSAYPSVKLNFQHRFRFCCSNANIILKVQVSNDGGSTWVDYDVRNGVSANTVTANPKNESINISAAAGGQANVLIRFYKAGASHYFWMVDDVAIIEAPDHDVTMREELVDFYYQDGGFYKQTPISQTGDITFRAAVFNDGALTQTNVNLNVDINDGTSSVYNQTSPSIASYPTLTNDTLYVTTVPFVPAAIGTYTTTFTINQTETDQIPANNTKTVSFSVSDTVFARDNGNVTTAGAVGPANWVGGDADGSRIATLYEFIDEAEITSMSVYVHTNCTIGGSFRGVLYEIDGNGDFIEIMETDYYDITSNADKDKWVTLPFINKDGIVDIVPVGGKDYVVAIETAGAPNRVWLANDLTTNQPDVTSFLFIAGGTQWGWISRQPFMRLNIAPSDVSIAKHEADQGVKLLQNKPNPASKNTTITYETATNGNVSLKVFDVAGKEVMFINEGNKAAGRHNINLNVAALSGGVYYYTLSAGENNLTKKMVIIE